MFVLEQRRQGITAEGQEICRVLGDAVLDFIMIGLLFERGIDAGSKITQENAKLVNVDSL